MSFHPILHATGNNRSTNSRGRNSSSSSSCTTINHSVTPHCNGQNVSNEVMSTDNSESSLSERRSSFTSQLLSGVEKCLGATGPVWDPFLNRVPLMMQMDSKRMTTQHSPIELNQTMADTGRDLLMQLIMLDGRIRLHDRMGPSAARQQLNSIVWPHLLTILKQDDVQYDVHRTDKHGLTVLHHICSYPLLDGSLIVHLLDRLLQLGADPCAKKNLSGNTPLLRNIKSYRTPMGVIKRFLDHGTSLNDTVCWNGRTCIHWMVWQADLAMLRSMFLELPHCYTSAIDYSIEGQCWRTGRMVTVVELARSLCKDAEGDEKRAKAPAIFDLLTSEREKQYTEIRSSLQHHTPLRLNQATNLTTIVFSYIAASDYDSSRSHQKQQHQKEKAS